MTSVVFDAGPVISLATNGLLWLLSKLKAGSKSHFYVSEAVKKELVDVPLNTKKFKFEALKVNHSIDDNTIEVLKSFEIDQKAELLLGQANTIFYGHNNPIRIVHYGEMSGLAAAIHVKAECFVVDERTTRLLIENPRKLKNILSHTLHTEIRVDQRKLREFLKTVGGIKIIRSVEIAVIAYELGYLDIYLTNVPSPKKTLLESVLWGLKLNGCSVSNNDIGRILRLETREID